MDYHKRILKLVTYIFICISGICAIGVFVAGIVLYVMQFDDMDWHLKPYFCVLGIIASVLAGVGICAVYKENDEILTGYAVVALIFFVIQIAVAVLAIVEYLHRYDLTRKVEWRLLQKYYEESHTMKGMSIVMTHIIYRCCGVNGPYGGEVKVNSTSVVGSCCGSMHEASCPIENAYQQGCLPFEVDKSVFCGKVIGTTNIAFGIVHLFCGVLAAIFSYIVVKHRSNPN